MRSMDESGKPSIRIYVNRGHQIQTQESKIGEVILCKLLAAEMRVNTSQTAETTGRNADPLEIRKLDSAIVTNHHVLNVSLTINEHSDLAASLVRQFSELTSKFWSNDLIWRNAARIEFFYTTKLVRF
jgi:hypothetical protein